MSPNKECPKQFVTVSMILGVLYAISFIVSVILVSNTQPMLVFWFYGLPSWISRLVLGAIFLITIYLSTILKKPVVWFIFSLVLIMALAGWVYNFQFWEGRLIIMALYSMIFYLLAMLRQCRIWAAFIFTLLVGLDLFNALYDSIIAHNGIPLASLIIDLICLVLLIKGYLEYRKGSHIDVPPSGDALAASRD